MSEQYTDTTNVMFVAGGGARVRTSSVMYTYMRQTADAAGVPYECVDGTHEGPDGELFVSPPSHQLKLIEARLTEYSPEEKVLIVTQCLGTVASLTALEKSLAAGRAQVKLLTVSPPLPNPHSTLSTPRSASKRANGTMKTWDLPADGSLSIDERLMTLRVATVPAAYEQEHYALSGGFSDRLRDAVEGGYAMAVATEQDWNTAARGAMRGWGGAVIELANVGHSLNPSYGNVMPYDELLAGQRKNARSVLLAGLDFSKRA